VRQGRHRWTGLSLEEVHRHQLPGWMIRLHLCQGIEEVCPRPPLVDLLRPLLEVSRRPLWVHQPGLRHFCWKEQEMEVRWYG